MPASGTADFAVIHPFSGSPRKLAAGALPGLARGWNPSGVRGARPGDPPLSGAVRSTTSTPASWISGAHLYAGTIAASPPRGGHEFPCWPVRSPIRVWLPRRARGVATGTVGGAPSAAGLAGFPQARIDPASVERYGGVPRGRGSAHAARYNSSTPMAAR